MASTYKSEECPMNTSTLITLSRDLMLFNEMANYYFLYYYTIYAKHSIVKYMSFSLLFAVSLRPPPPRYCIQHDSQYLRVLHQNPIAYNPPIVSAHRFHPLTLFCTSSPCIEFNPPITSTYHLLTNLRLRS